MRIRVLGMSLTVVGIFAVVTMLGAGSQKAEAAIHEGPVASWCSLLASGNLTPLFPPGISGQSSADNVAQPLFASGMLLIAFDGPGGPGFYITPNTAHPAVKVKLLAGFEEVEPGFFIRNFEPDPEFPAFMNCPNFDSHPHP